MKNISNKNILFIIAALFIGGCSTYDNFTTYFNTYYNQSRLIDESEDDFAYQDEKKRVMPKVFISQPDYWVKPDPRKSPVLFMEEFVIEQRKLQPVKVKLDSVIIKGSKILAKHPNSNFVERTLYLMAKAYFYQSDWINCQVKCSELIDKFPTGDLSPDAHLMIAKTYLVRRKTLTGLTILSRTVDVAWLKKRYDILSEAFRLQADVALFESRFEDALKPYLQAIAQCDDNQQKARWQVDLAALLYRIGRYDKAAKAFQQVKNYSPDYQGIFESEFYNALCQIRLGNNAEGMQILDKLENDKKFEEWKDYITAGRLLNYTLTKDKANYAKIEQHADTTYSNSYMIQAIYFEKAMMLFEKKDYQEAKKYFAQVRNAKSDYFTTANRVYQNLQFYTQKQETAFPGIKKFNADKNLSDSAKMDISNNVYEFARINEVLGNSDTATAYYKTAMDIAPLDSNSRARYVYSYQRMIRDKEPMKADSLFEQIADLYPKTEFGKEAYKKLGYTEYYAIDTLQDLYKSANQMRKNGLHQSAVETYKKIYNNYRETPFAPKSVYSIGWVYENNIRNMDSAAFYYNIILKDYPKSEYANEIRTSMAYRSVVKSGETVPDTLLPRRVSMSPKRDYLKEIESGNEIERTNHFQQQQHFKKEKSKLEQYWDSLKDQFNPTNQIDSLKSKFDGGKSLIPGVNISNPLDSFKSKDSTNTSKPIELKQEEAPKEIKKENEKERKK